MKKITTQNLGFPRIGLKRELKFATEKFWRKKISESELQTVTQNIRQKNWELQKNSEIDIIPSNDFSFYDQMLDMSVLLGVIPKRFSFSDAQNISLENYFEMARGGDQTEAMEMTKWFDTNYHYLVPEFENNQQFNLLSTKIFDEYTEAKNLGIETTPILIGPFTFLYLGKTVDAFDKFSLLQNLISIYEQIFQKLENLGVKNIQIHEPIFSLDLSENILNKIPENYEKLKKIAPNLKWTMANYFGPLRENLDTFLSLPAEIFHFDFVRAPEEVDLVLSKILDNKKISAGVVNGRNIWKNDFSVSLEILEKISQKIGKENLIISPSCSLQHSPVSLSEEKNLDPELASWLSFSTEKLNEVKNLANILEDKNKFENILVENQRDINNRKNSQKIHKQNIKEKVKNISAKDFDRKSPFNIRQKIQQEKFNLPIFPTTTIGSFPQTQEVRQNRLKFKKGIINAEQYEKFCEEEIKKTIKIQEDLDIDVLVHGEFERNDMVEYFGENFSGFTFTQNGWVQSYGSRCVKPPIIFGDISREKPITVKWSKFSQNCTKRIMKGMLTGPITILQWSFVRDDQPRSDTAFQIALALKDEILDLEAEKIEMIQVDEPALREGLPLRKSDTEEYLKWAVNAFKLSVSSVKDTTQIHTHMCYCDFNDIMPSIAALDADVISIEASRSKMELLESFKNFNYPNEIGPGVWDIHSPRVPSTEEMVELLKKALEFIPKENLWVNPDCGLKTRGWTETLESLKNLVEAAKILRNSKK